MATFHCRRCGNCCRHPGEVRLDPDELDPMAAALGMDVPGFTERFTLLRADRRGLLLAEKPDGACVFLDEPGAACRIQAAKPRQCRDFPSRWRYDNMAGICPASASDASA